jgi:hypothetical protein
LSRVTNEYVIVSFDGHSPPCLASWAKGDGPHRMGNGDWVRSSIDLALADVDWSAPDRGFLEGGDFAIELGVAASGPVDGFVVRTRGSREATTVIAHLCRVNGWAAVDCATGDYLDLDDPSLS